MLQRFDLGIDGLGEPSPSDCRDVLVGRFRRRQWPAVRRLQPATLQLSAAGSVFGAPGGETIALVQRLRHRRLFRRQISTGRQRLGFLRLGLPLREGLERIGVGLAARSIITVVLAAAGRCSPALALSAMRASTP